MTTPVLAEVTGVDLKMLRAVQIGRACIAHGTLLVDGLPCCDQIAARRLVDNRLVVPAGPGSDPVRAMLTDSGAAALTGGAR